MMPIQVAIGNYYFIGSCYFTEWRMFILGTVIVSGLYTLSAVLLTALIRWTIQQYPQASQAVPRTLLMLLLSAILTVALVVFDVFVYSLAAPSEVFFTWASIRPILLWGVFFDLILCTILSMFYTYTQWQREQTENKQLKEAVLHHQLDTLKIQISPHFLFNSLNSLSSLIGEDQKEAEQFVDQLAKVYRYLLQANNHQLVTLQTELEFMVSYINLLQTRYGSGLCVIQRVDPAYMDHSLPPLSLQTLIDNAIKHNTMRPGKPLSILIRTTQNGRLMVQNTLQRKVTKVEMSGARLANLTAKYRLLDNGEVRVVETDTHFGVTLPLLPQTQSIPS